MANKPRVHLAFEHDFLLLVKFSMRCEGFRDHAIGRLRGGDKVSVHPSVQRRTARYFDRVDYSQHFYMWCWINVSRPRPGREGKLTAFRVQCRASRDEIAAMEEALKPATLAHPHVQAVREKPWYHRRQPIVQQVQA